MTDHLPTLPPADVVPRRGLTLDALATLNQMCGQPVEVTTPGELLLDLDGIPTGVGPSTTTTAPLAGVTFTVAEVTRLGGHPDDYPNLRFI